MKRKLRKYSFFQLIFLIFSALIIVGCTAQHEIVSHIDEKEANVILVLLKSKGIPASKTPVSTTGGAGDSGAPKYSIMVPETHLIEAIAYLNQNGFPRQKGTNLLDLFAKQGLMTSDKEETIRYQAGLAQQLANTILMIDGVIDASVQLSFPPEVSALATETEKQAITAAVYVKHQGIIDDPNIHLENKIKRLISGSISGLDINNVTVVADRSRFTDITLSALGEPVKDKPSEYVSIWSIIMNKESAGRFRFLFFLITSIAVLFALALGWLSWKFYPILKKKSTWKEMFNPVPWLNQKTPPEESNDEEEPTEEEEE
ncbi:MAG: type III secretion inner membrane ring lipoprotein SctJ [Chlamydiota bacterium]